MQPSRSTRWLFEHDRQVRGHHELFFPSRESRMSLYDRPVRIIMREMAAAMGLAAEETFTRDDAIDWFKTNFPLVKEGTVVAHLARLSTNNKSRLHYSARLDDDVFFQIDGSRFRLYDPKSDPAPIHAAADVRENASDDTVSDAPSREASEFAYERDLRDFLARNLQHIERGLRLYEEEGVTGVEFPAGNRFIDILAIDAHGDYVVVELKVSKGYDRTVGQLLRYMAWIERHHAESGQRVRGVIVAKEISNDLRLACTHQSNILLFEYSLSVSLRPIVG